LLQFFTTLQHVRPKSDRPERFIMCHMAGQFAGILLGRQYQIRASPGGTRPYQAHILSGIRMVIRKLQLVFHPDAEMFEKASE
jgi:hypothetical protein